LYTPSTHLVLNKLITLTNERDAIALEHSLAKTLFDLMVTFNAESARSVVIYHAVDIRKQLFSTVVIDKNAKEDSLPPLLKQTLTNCFKSGEYCTYEQGRESSTRLYPVKNAKGNTIAIIAIEAQISDPHVHETITLLLQIYQNINGLINDNEHDTLTGLLNRKTFECKINKVLAQMHNTNKRKVDEPNQVHFLVIFDIDHFKRVNDEFGHLIGDEVLLLFAQLMKQTFRSSDPIFRYGGEEFVGMFECASHSNMPLILDRFRVKVSNFDFPQVGKVTISAGYTEINPDDVSSQVIDRADLALYFAKNNGRNRIGHYEQLIAEGALQDSKKEGEVELF
jgi:diguanylate cyclase (GGDEF)-like protein